jgi:hypothetical protein
MIAALRSVAAVLGGYVLFAACSFAVFRLSGHDPHAPAAATFMVAAVVSGIAFAVAGGFLAALLAGRRPLAHAVAVAALLAAGAAASLAATLGHGAVWSQTAAIVLMAPAAALGGCLRARSRTTRRG